MDVYLVDFTLDTFIYKKV